MTRETRIGLVVGLLFIIAFGLVLSELTGTASGPGEPDMASAEESSRESPVPVSHESPAAVERRTLAAERDNSASQQRESESSDADSAEEEEAPAPTGADRSQALEHTQRARTAGAVYTVRSGDTLVDIAERFYGSRRKYRRILEANADRVDDPGALKVGDELVIPPPAGESSSGRVREMSLDELREHFGADRRTSSANDGPRTYTVQRGDNLTKIARRFYDDDDGREAVMKIYRANRDVLSAPDVLPLGAELKIPR
ncbi:MAG: LysM peptidoglycan-binding domain-containing protein [Phycisphaerae bacterium]